MTDTQTSPQQPDARARLRQHFLHPSDTHGGRWDELWEQGTFLPWDRGMPNPALMDTLEEKRDTLGPAAEVSPTGKITRRKALVPGCGKGYDVLLLSSYGYDAYGLEISAGAVKECGREKERVGGQPPYYAAKDEAFGHGQAVFLHGDFFQAGWLTDVFPDLSEEPAFELIYDYTFLSALPPSFRPAWAFRMSQLLRAGSGRLVCVEFPTYKDISTGGPPYALPSHVYLRYLAAPGRDLREPEERDERVEGHLVDLPFAADAMRGPVRPLRRLAHWPAERTHEIGKGTDCVSIWRHSEG